MAAAIPARGSARGEARREIPLFEDDDEELTRAIAASYSAHNADEEAREARRAQEELELATTTALSLTTAAAESAPAPQKTPLTEEQLRLATLVDAQVRDKISLFAAVCALPRELGTLISSYSFHPDCIIDNCAEKASASPELFLANEELFRRVIQETGQLTLRGDKRKEWSAALADPKTHDRITALLNRLPAPTSLRIEVIDSSALFSGVARSFFAHLEHLDLPWAICKDARTKRVGTTLPTVLESSIFQHATRLFELILQFYALPERGVFTIPATVRKLELKHCRTRDDEVRTWVLQSLSPGYKLVDSSYQCVDGAQGQRATMALTAEQDGA